MSIQPSTKDNIINFHHTLKQHKYLKYPYKGILISIGFLLLLAGIAMLVLPGPGIATILLGIGILSLEFSVFNQMLKQIKGYIFTLKIFLCRKIALKRMKNNQRNEYL